MGRKKTHEEYVLEIELANPNIQVVEEYNGRHNKIKHSCKTCGYEWFIMPSNALQGVGCPKCNGFIRRTHEQYVVDVSEKNPNIEVIDEFINLRKKIKHRCIVCNHEWLVRPDSILDGSGCPNCADLNKSLKQTKTHEEYVIEAKKINPDIKVIDSYNGSNTNIKHICLVCGHEWFVRPNSVLHGGGCPKCNGGVRKTHEEYVRELAVKNPNIEVLELYSGADTPILHKCLKDGWEWKGRPTQILSGSGCPKCANRPIRTHEQYVEELKVINPLIVIVDDFVSMSIKATHRCLVDGYEWKVLPTQLFAGGGCPKCSGIIHKSHEEYVSEVARINNGIEVIDKYINSKTSIKHRCLKCDNEWFAYPTNILAGQGCPKCTSSKGEKFISEWLDSNNITYEQEKKFINCKDKLPLPFDFYLPDYNITIEYNGRQHYESVDYFGGEEAFIKRQLHDKIKEDYCKENDIRLIIIPYFLDINEELSKLYDLIMSEDNVFKEVAV